MRKWYNKLFLNDIRNAVENYNLINNGDRILVGLSGGKDSIFLLYGLMLLRENSYLDFHIAGCHIDIDVGVDMSPIEEFCQKNSVQFIKKETDIIKKALDDKKSPCYLCSKFKRGAISDIAKENNFNKIAFGHHKSDVVETLLMNIIFTGQLGTFKPNTYNDEKKLYLIRPLIYVEENTIEKVVSLENLPLAKGKKCPLDKETKREEIKDLVSFIKKKYPDFEDKSLKAIENIDLNSLWHYNHK